MLRPPPLLRDALAAVLAPVTRRGRRSAAAFRARIGARARRLAALVLAAATAACVDASSPPAAADPPAPPPAAPFPAASDSSGGWFLFDETPPGPDRPRVTISARSQSHFRIGAREVVPTLHVRCMDDRTATYLHLGLRAEVGPEPDRHVVRWRLDATPAVRETWTASADGEALFAPRAIPLARRIAASDRLVVEVTPAGQTPSLLLFDLRGARPLVGRVAAACGWRP